MFNEESSETNPDAILSLKETSRECEKVIDKMEDEKNVQWAKEFLNNLEKSNIGRRNDEREDICCLGECDDVVEITPKNLDQLIAIFENVFPLASLKRLTSYQITRFCFYSIFLYESDFMWDATDKASSEMYYTVVNNRRLAVGEALRLLLNTVVCVNTDDEEICVFLLDLNDATYRIIVRKSLISEIYGFYFLHSDEKNIYPFLNTQGLFEEWKITQEYRKMNIKAAKKELDWARMNGDKRVEKNALEMLRKMGYEPNEN